MTQYLTDETELDFELLNPETILLNESDFHQARELSRPVNNLDRQWQVYLTALSLFAFEKWLAERLPNIAVNHESCSLVQLPTVQLMEGACFVDVGHFKICILPQGSLTDEAVFLSRASLEVPELVAHFYVITEVIEELEEAVIVGFARYDQLINQVNSRNLSADSDWNYSIPTRWFERETENLLLYLRCLEPEAIVLPATPVRARESRPEIQAQLSSLLPHLKSSEQPWQKLLTWEQATAILTDSSLLNWLDRELNSTVEPAGLTQKILNVGLWLRDEIDDLARELSWVLLPAFNSERFHLTATSGLRSPVEELEAIVTQLERRGTAIPPAARGAYQHFNLASVPLRLYVVTWPFLSTENIPEWKLLLILGGSPSGTRLPSGTKMQIHDNSALLVEQTLNLDTREPYLYSLVVGTWEEQFSVTVSTNGASLTLPPFAFRSH